ncbi:MAG: cytidine deaminase [Tetragenococcus halophilus]|nr:cytidine deaminase [Tetragenococcus halophilus]
MKPIQLRQLGTAGHVACALESIDGNIYTGICIDMPCSIGLCAEQSAIAEMLKNGKTQITKLIAVYEDGSILPPCGRCREFISQLDNNNYETKILLPTLRETSLNKLLPERWDDKWNYDN